MLLLLAGVAGDGVRAYGAVAFSLAQNSTTDTTLANTATSTTTTAYDATTETD